MIGGEYIAKSGGFLEVAEMTSGLHGVLVSRYMREQG